MDKLSIDTIVTNRILEENKERADEYYNSELFYNRDYPYKLDYLRDGHPAEIKEIEFRQPVKEYEIWMEGYAATGEYGPAQMIGKGIGTTFDEAVKDYMSKKPNHGIEENGRKRYTTDEAYYNRKSNWNIWACNLFDNEADARKAFG